MGLWSAQFLSAPVLYIKKKMDLQLSGVLPSTLNDTWSVRNTKKILTTYFSMVFLVPVREDGYRSAWEACPKPTPKGKATDPLPCSGLKSCQRTIESLSRLATTLKVQTRFSKHMLPKALPQEDWHNPRTLRQHVQNVAQQLSIVARIRIADKRHFKGAPQVSARAVQRAVRAQCNYLGVWPY